MGEVRDPGFSILPHTNSSFKDGVAYERSRIIKLLEELESVGREQVTHNYLDTEELIALIKEDRANIPKRFRDISNGE